MTSDVPATPASYRGLLALVIVLGVLIVIGVGALVAGAILGAGRRADIAAPYVTAVPAPGARIESAEMQGNRILMRLTGGEGDELLILDAASGRLLGRIHLESTQ